MSLWRQSKEGAHIGCATEPFGIIDQSDEAESVDRPDARNRHQAARNGVFLGPLLYGFVEVVCRVA
jgi:hypothetical protein